MIIGYGCACANPLGTRSSHGCAAASADHRQLAFGLFDLDNGPASPDRTQEHTSVEVEMRVESPNLRRRRCLDRSDRGPLETAQWASQRVPTVDRLSPLSPASQIWRLHSHLDFYRCMRDVTLIKRGWGTRDDFCSQWRKLLFMVNSLGPSSPSLPRFSASFPPIAMACSYQHASARGTLRERRTDHRWCVGRVGEEKSAQMKNQKPQREYTSSPSLPRFSASFPPIAMACSYQHASADPLSHNNSLRH
jgi:hypothetical protein